jgi:hypothetical protein
MPKNKTKYNKEVIENDLKWVYITSQNTLNLL